jgi:hypothetical protein
MNAYINNLTSKSYSFLAWLIVPVLLTWLGSSYIIGALVLKPSWSGGQTDPASLSAAPFERTYPQIQQGKSGMVTIWFDDAWISQYMVAEPILKAAGMTAAIAVPTGTVGYPSFTNWAELRALQSEGWEIDNHSVSHDCSMETWTTDKMQKEFTESTNELWKQKLTSDIFVSPCGVNSPDLIAAAQKNFVAFRGTEPGYNDLNNLDPFDLKVRNITNTTSIEEIEGWINDARKSNLWVILVFHQVGADGETGNGEKYSINTEEFQSMVDFLKTSPVKVVLPSQALSLRKSN